ncbi:MAG TPA: cytochrome C oxidase subunit IV family protein [Saprospiraceae bacterium]|nr:cytochrome C oxidase subunit IV family protein [Saprospiraceae bacterium]
MAESYEKSKKIATKTILILAVITVVEVLLALAGKGYLISGFEMSLILIGGFMIILSAFKAYLIVYEFMHMKYEMPGLRKTVLLPTLLLSWALIAFLWEGDKWGDRRDDGISLKQEELNALEKKDELEKEIQQAKHADDHDDGAHHGDEH